MIPLVVADIFSRCSDVTLPLECERLQGFSDFWTKVDDNTAFSKRINALGRSMAVPVIRWIGEQIKNSTTLDV